MQALRELGGSGTITEINDKAIELAGLSEEKQAVPTSAVPGRRSSTDWLGPA